MPITTIGVDADDTLWHNESFFRLTQQHFAGLLAPFDPEPVIAERLEAVERRNLALYGYGAKGFALSMIETAVEISEGRVPAAVIAEILAAGRQMLAHPVEPLPGVAAALDDLAQRGRLILITKGDLLHQESKLAASGLGALFYGVEIVSEKSADTYRRSFRRHGSGPESAVMAGNSVRSDVLPALEAGCWAALIPYPLVWPHEAATAPHGHAHFRQLAALGDLAGWIDAIT